MSYLSTLAALTGIDRLEIGRRRSDWYRENVVAKSLEIANALSEQRGRKISGLRSSGRLTIDPNLTPLLPTHIIRRVPKSDRSY
jgi:hypothetical protein